MHSKYLPWDFFQHYSALSKGHNSIQVFIVSDPFLERMVKTKVIPKESHFRVYFGNEISKNFIEEQFVNLSFFHEPQNMFIFQSEMMATETLEFLLNDVKIDDESQVILFFSKGSKPILDILKKCEYQAYEIESPRFWEGPKILSLCLKELKINLPNEIQKFLLENIEHNFESFVWALNVIALNFPEGNINISFLRELICKDRYDFFDLVDVYHRDRALFFKTLESRGGDFDWLRGLFSSMSGHLVKILFPEEIMKKDRPSQYDQKILFLSEKIQRNNLKSELDLFSSFEILAKARNEFLKDRIKLESLK